MKRIIIGFALLVLFTGVAHAGKDKLVSGMSIVGNDEAPKALVIVPWKSSELGDRPDVSKLLGDGRQPVDRDVFKRELQYYQIRTATQAPPRPGKQ